MRQLIFCRKEKRKMVARRMSRGRSIEGEAVVQEAPTHCVKGNTGIKPVTGNRYPCRNEWGKGQGGGIQGLSVMV